MKVINKNKNTSIYKRCLKTLQNVLNESINEVNEVHLSNNNILVCAEYIDKSNSIKHFGNHKQTNKIYQFN
jgi:hypothetical protein